MTKKNTYKYPQISSLVFSLTTRATGGVAHWRCCLQIWLFGHSIITGLMCFVSSTANHPTKKIHRQQASIPPLPSELKPAPIENYMM